MNRVKRMLAILLTAVMASSMLAGVAFADGEELKPVVVHSTDDPNTVTEGDVSQAIAIVDNGEAGKAEITADSVEFSSGQQKAEEENASAGSGQEAQGDPEGEQSADAGAPIPERYKNYAVAAVGDGAAITIKEDVTAEYANEDSYYPNSAVFANNKGEVSVAGDVTLNAKVENSRPGYYSPENYNGVEVYEEGKATIGGDVTLNVESVDTNTYSDGVYTQGSTVEINGNIVVNSKKESSDSGNNNKSRDSNAESTGIHSADSTVNVGGNVTVSATTSAVGVSFDHSLPNEISEYIIDYYLKKAGIESREQYNNISPEEKLDLPKLTEEEFSSLLEEVTKILQEQENDSKVSVKGNVMAAGGDSATGVEDSRGEVTIGGDVTAKTTNEPEKEGYAVQSKGVVLNGRLAELTDETKKELFEILQSVYGGEEDNKALSGTYGFLLPVEDRLASMTDMMGNDYLFALIYTINGILQSENDNTKAVISGGVTTESTDVSKAVTNSSADLTVNGTISSKGASSAGVITFGDDSTTNVKDIHVEGKDAAVGVVSNGGTTTVDRKIEVKADENAAGIILSNGSVTVGDDVTVESQNGTGVIALQMDNRIITIMGAGGNPSVFDGSFQKYLSDDNSPFTVVDGTIKAQNGVSYVDQGTLATIAENYLVNCFNNNLNNLYPSEDGKKTEKITDAENPLKMTEEQLKQAAESTAKAVKEAEKKYQDARAAFEEKYPYYWYIRFDENGNPVEVDYYSMDDDEKAALLVEYKNAYAENGEVEKLLKESQKANNLSLLYNSCLELRKIKADNSTPDITTWKIEADNIVNTGKEEFSWKEFLDTWGINIDTEGWDDLVTIDYGQNAEAVRKNINYIIRIAGVTGGDGTITLGGTRDSHGYATAREGEEVTIYVSCPEGYYVDSVYGGEYVVTLIRNADGTWTLIVPAGGGVEISAVLKAIEQAQETGATEVTEVVVPAAFTPVKVGLILPGEEIEKDSSVEQIWNTLQEMDKEDPFFTAASLKSKDKEAQMKNIDDCVAQGFGLVVCVGEDMADVVKEAAEKYPDQKFVLMDDNDASALLSDETLKLTNVADVLFTADHKDSDAVPTDHQVRLALQDIFGQMKEGKFEGKTYTFDTTD